MSEQASDTLRSSPGEGRQTMSIHTRKITDSCRDKDCIEDLRVYLTTGSQAILDTAANARVRCAELLTTYIDVEPVAFDGHHYCIDVTFYYRILADAVVGSCRPATLYGLAVFTKRAVLCGEDSRAHIYRSDTRLCAADGPTRASANLPTAVVDTADTKQEGAETRACESCLHRVVFRGRPTYSAYKKWTSCPPDTHVRKDGSQAPPRMRRTPEHTTPSYTQFLPRAQAYTAAKKPLLRSSYSARYAGKQTDGI